MKQLLPVHPSLRHPLTGQPLRAVYIDKHGTARYPVMGAGPEEDEAAEKAAAEAKAKEEAEAKAKAEAEAAAKAKEGELGFPKDTPVAEMTTEQQAAYWKHHSRQHEGRNKELRSLLGDKTPEQVKADMAELEKIRQEKLTPSEKQIEEAKKAARDAAAKEFAPKLVGMAFDTALSHIDEDKRKELIDTLDLSKFIDEKGDVDTAKVKTVAGTIAPAGKETGKQRADYGAGHRDSRTASGVAAGAERYAERHKKPTSKE